MERERSSTRFAGRPVKLDRIETCDASLRYRFGAVRA
jgi:hypothetical protein